MWRAVRFLRMIFLSSVILVSALVNHLSNPGTRSTTKHLSTIHPFIHSLDKCLLSAYHVPDTALGAGRDMGQLRSCLSESKNESHG